MPTRADDVFPGYPNHSEQAKRSKKWDAHHDEIEDVGSDETPPNRCEVEADEVVDYLWEGLVQPSFKPMYGRATQADRALVSMSTRGRIRSREIQPEYEEED